MTRSYTTLTDVTGQSAPMLEIREDQALEVLLSKALSPSRESLRRTVGFPDKVIPGISIVPTAFHAELPQCFALFRNRRTLVKFIPDPTIEAARAGQSLDPARPFLRIQRGEVVQLHRDASGCPRQSVSQRDDFRIVLVLPSEGDALVQVERE
ncbi:MAG TPA: hypothetical protein VLW85_24000 [Myxococcales bacterium]|nr:hypothetical protein [Myxococcales bacterium]